MTAAASVPRGIAIASMLASLFFARAAAASDDRIRLDPPQGWPRATLDPPDLSGSPQVSLEQWSAWGPLPEVRLVAGCFTTTTTTWANEADDLALDKLAAVASSTALRIAKVGSLQPAGRERAANALVARLEGSEDAKGKLTATTLLGFEDERLHACFALCVAGAAGEGGDCSPSVAGARLIGRLTPPPQPGLATRSLLALVHHPAATAWSVIGLSIAAGALAVATRKRPGVRGSRRPTRQAPRQPP